MCTAQLVFVKLRISRSESAQPITITTKRIDVMFYSGVCARRGVDSRIN